MIKKLKQIRDDLLSAFTSSITRLEPDPHEVPDTRDVQLEKHREEAEKLLQQFKESSKALRAEIEAFGDALKDEDPA